MKKNINLILSDKSLIPCVRHLSEYKRIENRWTSRTQVCGPRSIDWLDFKSKAHKSRGWELIFSSRVNHVIDIYGTVRKMWHTMFGVPFFIYKCILCRTTKLLCIELGKTTSHMTLTRAFVNKIRCRCGGTNHIRCSIQSRKYHEMVHVTVIICSLCLNKDIHILVW